MKLKLLVFSLILCLLPLVLHAEDLNEIAYQNRFLLKAGTILNSEGKGDCLIYPYFDVRTIDGKKQETILNIENFGQSGIVARLRFRESSRGKELFYKDIFIPSNGVWSGELELNSSGYRSNAKITSPCPVVTRYDSSTFYVSYPLLNGVTFSSRSIGFTSGESFLYGLVEVIGEEKTSPQSADGKVTRLAKSEQDCPNTLKGQAWINRVDDGVSASYQAIAIGNFSRGQGSLFRGTTSSYPKLDTCEDTLDQLEFQLSKWEIFGPFSISPFNEAKTSLIVTYPTKHFHYTYSKRINQVNNPFEAALETTGETLKTTISETEDPPVDSTLKLPYSVNIIGLYKDYYGDPKGVDNISMLAFAYDSGEATLTAENIAEAVLLEDFEYLQERFMMYRGLPAIGLYLYEYRNPDTLHLSIQPAEYSAVWEASTLESVFIPTILSGPSSGTAGESYTYTTGGSASSLGHPVQYLIDWGDGTDSGWLDSGTLSASKTWTEGGVYTLRARARCAFHTNVMSNWSSGMTVTIESVSPPTFLTGPTKGLPNTSYTYTTGGALSSSGHSVQYFFDWGDSTDSGWLPVGTTTATKFWAKGGEYAVRAKARCATDTSVVSEWTSTLTVKIELVTAPNTPVGPDKGLPGTSYTYMTGGATSNVDDPIEYQFDWGDGTFSDWQSGTTASKTWTVGGDYEVRARARCATHTSILSDWSSPLTVSIEKITSPTKPSGPSSGVPNTSYTYTFGGASSNIGDSVQYQIDWGDSTTSDWLSPKSSGTLSVVKVWSSGGIFEVKARARCATHTSIVSDWSEALTVTIELVSTPSAPTGPASGVTGTAYPYTATGVVSNLEHSVEYQFDWKGDGSDLSTWGAVPQSKTWTAADTYTVRARGRCKTHPSVVSDWSEGLTVTITSL